MEYFDIYDRFTYKYSLLYMLLLTCYKVRYSGEKSISRKILVLCDGRKELIKNYDRIYSTIKNLKPKDISVLKTFQCFYDKQLKNLFSKLDDKGINYLQIIKDIKQFYTEDKAIYINPKRNTLINVPMNKALIFTEFSDANCIYEKHLIREIFVPQEIKFADSNSRALCRTLETFVRDITKEKDILTANGTTATEFSNLSVFVNTDDGLDIADEVINNLKDDYIDE